MGFFQKDKDKRKPKRAKSYGSKPFKKSGYGSGDHGGSYRSRGPSKQLYKAVCAECGETAEVPFKPSGTKPVLCRDCFRSVDAGAKPRKFERGGFGERRSFDRARQRDDTMERRLNELSHKLDRVLDEIGAITEVLTELEVIESDEDEE